MKENSREEDRKILEKLINTMKSDRELFDEKTDKEIYTFFINALEHILSDYKRVLKENESLKEYNMEYRRILDLADDRIYRKKYLEERRKEQPNLLYPDSDEIYQRYYELKQENELKNDYENLNNSVVVKNYYIKNSIPIQKIKDKIEEIQEEGYWLFITDRDCNKCVEVLQQLLEKEQ